MATSTRTRPTWAGHRDRTTRGAGGRLSTGLAAVYRRRRPTATPLYPIVQHHLETFLARAAEADPLGEGVAGWVEEDFRAYLRCGILAHGFARVRCDDCAAERLVAFSCKGRGVCPSCNARRMVEVAAHLNDHVLPPLPVRQWVLSVPKRIRPFFHHDPALAGAVLQVLLRAVRTALRRGSPGAGPDAQIGAVSFLHRFGAALNPHFHFHVVVLDGVFTEIADGDVRFHESTHFSADDAAALAPLFQRRILRLFQRRGLLDTHTTDDMLTWQGTGGFSLDASVRIRGSDRAGRERLLRYCARPPFALDRLRIEREPGARDQPALADETHRSGAGPTPRGSEFADVRRVYYRPARPTPDGRALLALSPLEFLNALSHLIPPPRVHRHRYHGVLAPNARLRARVVALGRDDPDTAEPDGGSPEAAGTETAAHGHDDPAVSLTGAAAGSRWARLLARIYEVFPLRCPECGSGMRILAFLTDPEPTGAILRHLDLPHTPPRLSPARGPPQPAFDLDTDPVAPVEEHLPADDIDQTPAFDPADPEPLPDLDLDLDQTRGG
jgi:hypothetical protein